MNALKIERDPTTHKVTMVPMQLNPKTWFADVQTLCGGYIERAWVTKGERTKRGSSASLELWANEDGIAMDLTPTVQLQDAHAKLVGKSAPLFGTLVLIATTKAYGNPRPMTEAEKTSIQLVEDDSNVILTNKSDYPAILTMPWLSFGL